MAVLGVAVAGLIALFGYVYVQVSARRERAGRSFADALAAVHELRGMPFLVRRRPTAAPRLDGNSRSSATTFTPDSTSTRRGFRSKHPQSQTGTSSSWLRCGTGLATTWTKRSESLRSNPTRMLLSVLRSATRTPASKSRQPGASRPCVASLPDRGGRGFTPSGVPPGHATTRTHDELIAGARVESFELGWRFLDGMLSFGIPACSPRARSIAWTKALDLRSRRGRTSTSLRGWARCTRRARAVDRVELARARACSAVRRRCTRGCATPGG